jgi:hypothetical protein
MVTLNILGRSVSGACLYWFLHGSTNLWCHLLAFAGFWLLQNSSFHTSQPPQRTPSTATTPHPINGDGGMKAEDCEMAKVTPVIVKEPQPIINNAVYHRLEVELVAECVKLKT